MKTQRILARSKVLLMMILTLALLLGIWGGAPSPARAASLVVDSADDDQWAHDSMAGDGICQDQNMRCTLRAAIEEVNALPGADSITFNMAMQIDLDTNEGGLPGLVGVTMIDASSVWDYTHDCPGVVINGHGISFSGLYLGAGSSTIYGLQITGFGGAGIYIPSASNTVGGDGIGQRNVLSGNYNGILLSTSSAQWNMIQGNYIGLAPDGISSNPNQTNGILIADGANNNTIGGSIGTLGNVISGNLFNGIAIEQSGSDDNWVHNNIIGFSADLSNPLGNGQYGVFIYNGAANNAIGGNNTTGNFIGANKLSGVHILTAGNGTLVIGNIIVDNLQQGVDINGSLASVINNNIIHNNGQNGVRVIGGAAAGNMIWPNSITGNQLKGIHLQEGGNMSIASPIIQTANDISASGTACANCIVAVYSDPDDEGQFYSGITTADATGHWDYSGALLGPNVTATAIDGSGNTSEFSQPFNIAQKIFLPIVVK